MVKEIRRTQKKIVFEGIEGVIVRSREDKVSSLCTLPTRFPRFVPYPGSEFYLEKKTITGINTRAPMEGRGIKSQFIAKTTLRNNPE